MRWLSLTALVLTVAMTTIVIRISLDRGRLSSYPRVDDVIYMARGAEMGRAGSEGWHKHGAWGAVRGVARDWIADPPHSPWASVCVAAGFAAFGYREWAAYVFTAIPVLAFLLFAARLARRAGGRFNWRGHVLVVFAASAPFLWASVYNLKPDYCAGILAAIGMMISLRTPMLVAPRRRLVGIGAMFGLAVLAKPSMMLPTVLLCVGTLAICTLRDAAITGGRALRAGRLIRLSFRAALFVLAAAILVALPQFALAFKHAWNYTLRTLTGEGSESWALHASWMDHALYYLTGPGGHLMLDGLRSLAPIGGLIGASGLLALAAARRRAVGLRHRRVVYWMAMLAALLMAYLGPTISPVKFAQLASAFSALLWLAGIQAAAELVQSNVRWGGRAWVRIGAFAAIAASMAAFGLTISLRPADRSDAERVRGDQRTAFVERLYGMIRDEAIGLRARGREHVRLVVAGSPNDLGHPLLTLWSIRDGISLEAREVRRIPEPRPGDPNGTREAIAWRIFQDADLVLVGEAGTGLSRPKHETEGADAFYLFVAREHPDLVNAGTLVEEGSGKAFELYLHK